MSKTTQNFSIWDSNAFVTPSSLDSNAFVTLSSLDSKTEHYVSTVAHRASIQQQKGPKMFNDDIAGVCDW